MSGSLLVKHGFRLVFESNKVVLTKNGHFIGKGYLDENLFKLNVMAISQNVVESYEDKSFIYLLECSHLWYVRLGHVNFNTLQRLMKLELLHKHNVDPTHKCEICVEAKRPKRLTTRLKDV